jgi:hypothetical protein
MSDEKKVFDIVKRHQRDELQCNLSWLGEYQKHVDRGVLIRYIIHLVNKNRRLKNVNEC